MKMVDEAVDQKCLVKVYFQNPLMLCQVHRTGSFFFQIFEIQNFIAKFGQFKVHSNEYKQASIESIIHETAPVIWWNNQFSFKFWLFLTETIYYTVYNQHVRQKMQINPIRNARWQENSSEVLRIHKCLQEFEDHTTETLINIFIKISLFLKKLEY